MSNEVARNTAKNRYEITVDGVLAGFTVAEEDGEQVVFSHTEVFDEFEGKGLAGELVAGALDDVRSKGNRVIAECPYVAHFISKHHDYADLLA